jgi:hypothetical protein
MDGGRVQEREKQAETQSHWHENKVLTISSYRRDPPQEKGGDPEPVRLVTTCLGTMENSTPAYRAKGWPIGSGVTESGVRRFNKRVKGTERSGALRASRRSWPCAACGSARTTAGTTTGGMAASSAKPHNVSRTPVTLSRNGQFDMARSRRI